MFRFVLLVALTTLCVPSEACRLGWREFNGYCFGFFNKKLPWLMAASSCQVFNARLATVDSQRKQDWLVSQVESHDISFWIGATSMLHSPTFEWASTQKLLNYQNWNSGEPSNSWNNEECVEMRENKNYKWNDEDCETNNGFICETKDDSGSSY